MVTRRAQSWIIKHQCAVNAHVSEPVVNSECTVCSLMYSVIKRIVLIITHTHTQGILHMTGWINVAFKNVLFLCSVESWELCVSRCAWSRITFYLLCTISPSFTFWWSQLSHPQRSASPGPASVPRVMVLWSEQPFPQAEDISALTLLEEVTTVESRQDVAMTLVKIYLGQGLVVPFLDYLNTREVQHTSKYDKNDPTIVSNKTVERLD